MINVNQMMLLIKKHGALGVLVAWLVWTNMRLDAVEQKLYLCYDKITPAKIDNIRNEQVQVSKLYAIIPENIKLRTKKEI